MNNCITNIDALEELDSKFISNLDLRYNKISDINVFIKMSLQKLSHLLLSNNRIKNIRPLENLNISKIKTIFLGENLIDFLLQKNEDIIINLKKQYPQCFLDIFLMY